MTITEKTTSEFCIQDIEHFKRCCKEVLRDGGNGCNNIVVELPRQHGKTSLAIMSALIALKDGKSVLYVTKTLAEASLVSQRIIELLSFLKSGYASQCRFQMRIGEGTLRIGAFPSAFGDVRKRECFFCGATYNTVIFDECDEMLSEDDERSLYFCTGILKGDILRFRGKDNDAV